MPLTVDTFRNLANSSIVSGRDIVVRGENEAQTARNRLNNFCQQGGGAIAPGRVAG